MDNPETPAILETQDKERRQNTPPPPPKKNPHTTQKNKEMSTTDPTKNHGWTQVFAMFELLQFY
jgi:hypothetical protein